MTTKKLDLIKIIREDVEDYHQEFFNYEFYEDCYIPHYWQNPFVKFFGSEGLAGEDDFHNASLDYFEPSSGQPSTVNFETYPKYISDRKVITEDNYVESRILEHRILDIDCWQNEEPCWLYKKYPNILRTNPEEIMLKLKDLAFIPKDQWPDEVLENYNDRLEESKVIYAKYCTDYKVKEDEFNFFDMVKSWYLTDNTMFTRNEK